MHETTILVLYDHNLPKYKYNVNVLKIIIYVLFLKIIKINIFGVSLMIGVSKKSKMLILFSSVFFCVFKNFSNGHSIFYFALSLLRERSGRGVNRWLLCFVKADTSFQISTGE